MTKFYENFTRMTNGEFSNIKLNGATYQSKDGVLNVRFIISAFDISDFDEKKQARVQRAVEELFPGVKVTIQYIRTYADEGVVRNKILEYLNANNQMLFRGIRPENISVEVSNSQIIANFELSTALHRIYEADKIEEGLFDYLDRNFNYDIILSAKEIVSEENDISPIVLDTSVSRTSDVRLVNIKTGKKVFSKGNINGISQQPNYIADIKSESESVVLCGKVSNFQARTYKNKKYDPNEPKSGPEDLPVYKFFIDDTSGKINVTIFPRVDEADGIKTIFEMEQTVVCQGRVSVFNDSLSLTASSVFLCEIDYDSIHVAAAKPEPRVYANVRPKPVEEKYEQQSLLDDTAKQINDYFKNKSFVIFDLEATDKIINTAQIIQISALLIENGVEKFTFDTFVNPGIPIPPNIVEITGIDDDMVKDAPSIEEVIPDFYKFTRGTILVGHNIEGYDLPLLNRTAEKIGYPFKNECIDTLPFARKVMPELHNHKLVTLSKFFKIEHKNAHRADSDVRANWEVFKQLVDRK